MRDSIPAADQLSFTVFGEVSAALQPYIDAARTGRATASRAIWHDHARIAGAVDGAFMVLTPDELIGWANGVGPSPNMAANIVSLDVAGQAAAARIEFTGWAGFRFTDFFVLNRQAGQWQVTGKVYDAHGRNEATGTHRPAETEAEDFGQYDAIARTIDAYISCARSGDGRTLRPNWFDHAHVIGTLDGAAVDRDADAFCDRLIATGGAPNVMGRIVSIDRSGPAASARVELNEWQGIRYTDFLLLYRNDSRWRISAKSFDAHGRR